MTIKVCQTIGRNFSSSSSSSVHQWNLSYAEWIPNTLSSIIFLLALLGNTAALIVMFGWRGSIRITNNKYLANLACADLLRACFMPFTILARMKKNFIFGKIICQILPIVQGKIAICPSAVLNDRLCAFSSFCTCSHEPSEGVH